MQKVACKEDLRRVIDEVGLLPFFHTPMCFSLEDMIEPSVWFTDKEGPWQWKGQLARQKLCVYGRTFFRNAAFVAPDLFPALMCVRRNGYDAQGLWEDGLLSRTGHQILERLEDGPQLSKHIRKQLGSPKDFDRELIRLQMLTFVINMDFVYDLDKTGKPYGWGNALLTTPEQFLGMDTVNRADAMHQDEALKQILHRMGQEGSQWIRNVILGQTKF